MKKAIPQQLDSWQTIDPRQYPFSEELVRSTLLEGFEAWHLYVPPPPSGCAAFYAKKEIPSKADGANFIYPYIERALGPWASELVTCTTAFKEVGIYDFWMSDKSLRPPAPEIDRAIDAFFALLTDQRSVLLELAARYDELAKVTSELPINEKIIVLRKALPDLVSWAIVKTDTYESWYSTLYELFLWALDACGVQRNEEIMLKCEYASNSFESWIEPTQETKDQVCTELISELERILQNHD